MPHWKSTFTRLALDALYYSNTYRALESSWGGIGVIFTLHHVRPSADRPDFAPNRILEVSSEFLDRTLQQVKDRGFDIVSLDEARRRIVEADYKNKFVSFTLDDGYQDNYSSALPIFAKHNAPFAIYITTGLPDGTAVLWWRHLEDIIRQQQEFVLRLESRELRFQTVTTSQKYQAFDAVYWHLRPLPHAQQYDVIQQFVQDYGADSAALCRRHAMTWEMIRELSDGGLATIGAHTLNHYALSKLPQRDMCEEISASRQILLEKTGRTIDHFAYPYGDRSSAARREFDAVRELGFQTGTTTRKGMLFSEHANHLHALPRISLNGDYQTSRYVRLFLSGAPFALAQRFKRLDTE